MDIRIAVPDGLKGMSEARAAMFPLTTLQTCFVHLIRHRLGGASARDRKRLATARRPSYTAVSADVAAEALEAFASRPWGTRVPTVVASWRRAWPQVIPFLAVPPAVRRVIDTTNARVRPIITTRGHCPTDEAGHATDSGSRCGILRHGRAGKR